MSYPPVRDLAAEGIPVSLTCGVLGHSTQSYYAWAAAPISQRDLEDAYLTNALVDAHGDDPEFGYRFLADEVASAGLVAGERRIWRLCSQQKLWSTTVRKGLTSGFRCGNTWANFSASTSSETPSSPPTKLGPPPPTWS